MTPLTYKLRLILRQAAVKPIFSREYGPYMIKQLRDRGLIAPLEGYTLTDKGKEYLEKIKEIK